MADAPGSPSADRRIGVEIEFAGLGVHEAARVIADALGGAAERRSEHVARVHGTGLGDLTLELDTRWAKPPDETSGLLDRTLERFGARSEAANLLSAVVPVELVTEPLDEARLPLVDRAVEALGAAGAEGTWAAPLYAFGMHLNVALAHGGAERAIRIAAAFSFAERWIRECWAVDPARRLVPFIDPYPKGWRTDLAAAMAGGLPDLETFMRLYQTYNPTRNRALDLWPLLGHLDPPGAARIRGEPVRNARPAFHYRWPDSRVGEPGWSPWEALRRWDRIEAIGDDPAVLERLRAASLAVESGAGMLSTYMRDLDSVMG